MEFPPKSCENKWKITMVSGRVNGANRKINRGKSIGNLPREWKLIGAIYRVKPLLKTTLRKMTYTNNIDGIQVDFNTFLHYILHLNTSTSQTFYF